MGSDSVLEFSGFGVTYDDSDEEEIEEELPEKPTDPRSLLTSEQLQQYKGIFIALDPRGRGKIPTKVLGTIIRSLGHNPTKAQVREYISTADPEGKGLMEFQDFLLPLAQLIDAVPESFDDLLSAFKSLDESDLGYINTGELTEYLITLGEYLDDFEVEAFVKLADPKGEGKIYYEEFLDKQFGNQKKKPVTKKRKKK